MKSLLMTLKNNSANHVEIIKYPDGQQNVIVDLEYYDVKSFVNIECSIRNFNELETLLCITSALTKNDRIIGTIGFRYLFGLRSDRAFSVGQPNYLKDVLAPIINSIPAKFIALAVSHSLGINYITNVQEMPPRSGHDDFLRSFLIGGDQSVDFIDYAARFHKIRNEDGSITVNLTKTDLDKIPDAIKAGQQLLIVDDLCDAGGTFIAEAKYLRERFPDARICLFVYHALFTKGIDHVAEHFDHIYCTNSYQDIEHPKVHQIKVI